MAPLRTGRAQVARPVAARIIAASRHRQIRPGSAPIRAKARDRLRAAAAAKVAAPAVPNRVRQVRTKPSKLTASIHERAQPTCALSFLYTLKPCGSIECKSGRGLPHSKRFAIYGAYGVPKGLGVRQSSAALALNFREPKGFTRIPLRNNLNRRNYLGICFV